MSWLSDIFSPAVPPPAPDPVPPPDAVDRLGDALAVVAPKCDQAAWIAALSPLMRSAGITTPKRVAAFLGQIAVESGGLTVLSENLNYSADGLRATFPTHFTVADALKYARQPEKIANRAYCNRLGNGDEASGDGWRFRGTGAIQLTGRANVTVFAKYIGKTPEDAADWCRTVPGAAASACWFWAERLNGANDLADGWMITMLSKAVNGGTNGLTQRINLSNAALKALS